MRILHLLSQTHLTGAESYAVDLIDEQVKAGHLVWQISNQFHLPSQAAKTQMPVETKSQLEFWQSALKLRKFLIENQIQVVHCHSRAAAKLCSRSRMGIKSNSAERVAQISTVHGRQHPSISKKLFNLYGDMTVAVCENVQKQLVEEFNYNPDRIQVIGNGIDTKSFNPAAAHNKMVGSKIKIAVIGRCTGPKKTRTEIIVDALLKKSKNFEITLIGDRAQSVKTPDEAQIQIIDHTELNAQVYQNYDLIIGSGRVAIEAILSGVPCLAFGESSFLGLVTPESFTEMSHSNFGDIGLDFSGPHFDLDRFSNAWDQFEKLALNPAELLRLQKLGQEKYSKLTIAKKIERLYESAYFLRHYSMWIPILMYHKIPNQEMDSEHKIFVSKNNFEKHLKFFKWFQMKTITFQDLREFRRGLRSWSTFPNWPLILTFDDGYQNNLEHADPLLKKFGFKAHIYLLANHELPSNTWDQPDSSKGDLLVSGVDRKKWLLSQFEIGSHGIDHVHLPRLSLENAREQITKSKQMLESELKRPIYSYAYTYGDTNSQMAEMARVAGYDYAVNTDTGARLIEENPWAIFRVNIFPNENVWSLFKKTRSWYRNYYFRKRGQ